MRRVQFGGKESFSPESEPTKTGFLKKKGGFFGAYSRHWVTCEDDTLYIYSLPSDKNPSAVIPLQRAQVVIADNLIGKKNSLAIFPSASDTSQKNVYPGAPIHLVAETTEDRDDWLKVLSSASEIYSAVAEGSDPCSSNQFIQSMIQAMLDSVVVSDAQGKIIALNRTAEEMFCWNAADVIGKNVTVLMPQSVAMHHARFMESYSRTRTGNLIGKPRKVMGRRKDGTTLPVELSLGEMPLKSPIGAHFIAVFRYVAFDDDSTPTSDTADLTFPVNDGAAMLIEQRQVVQSMLHEHKENANRLKDHISSEKSMNRNLAAIATSSDMSNTEDGEFSSDDDAHLVIDQFHISHAKIKRQNALLALHKQQIEKFSQLTKHLESLVTSLIQQSKSDSTNFVETENFVFASESDHQQQGNSKIQKSGIRRPSSTFDETLEQLRNVVQESKQGLSEFESYQSKILHHKNLDELPSMIPNTVPLSPQSQQQQQEREREREGGKTSPKSPRASSMIKSPSTPLMPTPPTVEKSPSTTPRRLQRSVSLTAASTPPSMYAPPSSEKVSARPVPPPPPASATGPTTNSEKDNSSSEKSKSDSANSYILTSYAWEDEIKSIHAAVKKLWSKPAVQRRLKQFDPFRTLPSMQTSVLLTLIKFDISVIEDLGNSYDVSPFDSDQQQQQKPSQSSPEPPKVVEKKQVSPSPTQDKMANQKQPTAPLNESPTSGGGKGRGRRVSLINQTGPVSELSEKELVRARAVASIHMFVQKAKLAQIQEAARQNEEGLQSAAIANILKGLEERRHRALEKWERRRMAIIMQKENKNKSVFLKEEPSKRPTDSAFLQPPQFPEDQHPSSASSGSSGGSMGFSTFASGDPLTVTSYTTSPRLGPSLARRPSIRKIDARQSVDFGALSRANTSSGGAPSFYELSSSHAPPNLGIFPTRNNIAQELQQQRRGSTVAREPSPRTRSTSFKTEQDGSAPLEWSTSRPGAPSPRRKSVVQSSFSFGN